MNLNYNKSYCPHGCRLGKLILNLGSCGWPSSDTDLAFLGNDQTCHLDVSCKCQMPPSNGGAVGATISEQLDTIQLMIGAPTAAIRYSGKYLAEIF